ncbi:hypothetical protein GQ457_16G021650 [Hibiscus cannabinus]
MVQPETPIQQSDEIMFSINADSTNKVFVNKQKGQLSMSEYTTHTKEIYDLLATYGSSVSDIKHTKTILNGPMPEYEPFVVVLTASGEPYTLNVVVYVLKDNTPKLTNSSLWHSHTLWVPDHFHVYKTSIPATNGVHNYSSSIAFMEEGATPVATFFTLVPISSSFVTPLSSAELNKNGQCSNVDGIEEMNIPAHYDNSQYINDNDQCYIDVILDTRKTVSSNILANRHNMVTQSKVGNFKPKV